MDGYIEGTAKQIRDELMRIPDDQPVRLMVGRPSLSIIAKKIQGEALAKGMSENTHDELMVALKNDR